MVTLDKHKRIDIVRNFMFRTLVLDYAVRGLSYDNTADEIEKYREKAHQLAGHCENKVQLIEDIEESYEFYSDMLQEIRNKKEHLIYDFL